MPIQPNFVPVVKHEKPDVPYCQRVIRDDKQHSDNRRTSLKYNGTSTTQSLVWSIYHNGSPHISMVARDLLNERGFGTGGRGHGKHLYESRSCLRSSCHTPKYGI